jgi:hypothetical protein
MTAVYRSQNAAVGAAISGAATTTASVGIVTGGSGAAGAAYFSSKMSRRAADVSEFGFVQLTEWDSLEEQQMAADVTASTEGASSASTSSREQGGLVAGGGDQRVGAGEGKGGKGKLSRWKRFWRPQEDAPASAPKAPDGVYVHTSHMHLYAHS